MKALDTHRRVTAVPYQKPGFSASVGISVEECTAAVWAVAPDGRRYRGGGGVQRSPGCGAGAAGSILCVRLARG